MSTATATADAIAPDVLATLRKFDTPTVCNVIELFGIQPQTAGYTDARLRACFPKLPPMVGFAVTATFRSAFRSGRPDVYMGQVRQLEAFARSEQPPVVVFQDLDDPPRAATFGEVMCTTYKAYGAAGLVTSGAGRDLDQVEQLNFPCFTTGTIVSHGYPEIGDINVPVTVAGLTIFPGDLLHGDCNGLCVIPRSIAAHVARFCQPFADLELIVLDYVRHAKTPTIEGYTQRLEELVARTKELKAQALAAVGKS